MFNNSVALVLTHDRSWFAHLQSLALQVGFKECRAFPDNGMTLSRYRRGPLPFIFVHAGLNQRELSRVFTAVRAHGDLAIRFLPIVVLTDRSDADSVMLFIQMGCDDIVSLPLTAAGLIERLKHQVGRPRDYFQTDTYFGPDRRQHILTRSAVHSGRGKGEHFFRHFSILRHPQRGISIISSDVHFPTDQQELAATG